jgi:hypothetical protein
MLDFSAPFPGRGFRGLLPCRLEGPAGNSATGRSFL